MLKVKIKTKEAISNIVETDEEGRTHINYLAVNMEGSSFSKEFNVVGFKEYSFGLAIELDNGAYVHHTACTNVSDGNTTVPFLSKLEFLGDKYIKIGRGNYIIVHTLEIVSESLLDICSSCGKVADIVLEGKKVCSKCLEEKYTKLKHYNWKPDKVNFIGEQRKLDVDNPYHFGIEIEYGLNNKTDMGKLVFKNEEALYLKSDGSIRGGEFKAELVTEPHTFNALMDNCWIDDLPTLDYVDDREHNGCHIHISRTAFINDIHYAKWYFIIHEMKNINEFIGGRELTRYCSFNPTGKISRKSNIKYDAERSVMINERNDNTVECRFFSTTNKPDEVRANVQYLESLIKYTKYSKELVTIEGWRAYVNKKATKYKQLNEKLNQYTGDFVGSVEYRQPIINKVTNNTIPLDKLKDITSITTKSSTKIKDIYGVVGYDKYITVCYRDSDGDCLDRDIYYTDIKEIIWED